MSYSQLIHELFSMTRQGIKLDLSNIQKLDKALGFPSQAFTSIHVAGTNSKGSVTTKIASCLEYAGSYKNKKIGKYTSPHLRTFRERIQIQSQLISENDVEKHLPKIISLAKELEVEATFFEITTALAFLYFAENAVDIAVIETGMGGRLDATNIINPCMTVITSIDWDHSQYLGDSLEKIAYEKSGIIKKGVPVVLGPKAAPYEVFYTVAKEKEAPVLANTKQNSHFDLDNQVTARLALEHCSFDFAIHEKDLEKGLKKVPACRFEVIEKEIPIIFDVAHNPEGLSALFKRAKLFYPQFNVLCGLSSDKDLSACLSLIANNANHIYLTQAPTARAALTETLSELLISLGYTHFDADKSPEVALQKALSTQKPLIICGSFFIMSPIRKALGICEEEDFLLLNEKNFG